MSAVVDASVFVSWLSPHEDHHARATALWEALPDDLPVVVPSLFRVEVVSAMSRRRRPVAQIEAAEVLLRGPRFELVPVDGVVDLAMRVAREGRVRSYDAVYAAIALDRGLPLVTLDRELSDRLSPAFPHLEIRS